jgi:uncharacterized protein (DUF58 family)
LRGAAGLLQLRGALAALDARAVESDALGAAAQLQQLCPHHSLVVWFADLQDAAAAAELQQAMRLLASRHLPLVAAFDEAALRALMRAPARDWRGVYAAYAARQIDAGAARAVLELQRSGCEVVRVPPERMEIALFERYQQLKARRRV